ncbi:MAG: hypothetical protein IPK16_13830 [Anaerolineales bacterium]|nr:hypothetical protein [Anaerolineales bacterium]
MSAIEFPEYLRQIQDTLNEVISAGQALSLELQADQRSSTQGFIAGILYFADGTELHFREYVNLSAPEPRQMYAYHYQDADGQLIFRYDNAVHRPPLSAREHKHTRDSVVVILPPTLEQVIDEIMHDQGLAGTS